MVAKPNRKGEKINKKPSNGKKNQDAKKKENDVLREPISYLQKRLIAIAKTTYAFVVGILGIAITNSLQKVVI